MDGKSWSHHPLPSLESVKEKQGRRVQKWFKVLSKLQEVYYQVTHHSQHEKSFLAWDRNNDHPVVVPGTAVWSISPWE
jgi:hypothetical protein